MLSVSERKAAYALLSQLFSYPDRELLVTLAAGDHAGWAARLEAGPVPAAELSALEESYTDLFINRFGGVPAPPYGSVYLDPDGQLMGESTLAVAACYRQFGLSLEGTSDPADFLPTELEFLYFLVELEEAALHTGAVDAARQATAQQAEFARTWFFPWVATFCRRISDEPQSHPFYRWSADLLARFSRQEQDWLEQRLPACS